MKINKKRCGKYFCPYDKRGILVLKLFLCFVFIEILVFFSILFLK